MIRACVQFLTLYADSVQPLCCWCTNYRLKVTNVRNWYGSATNVHWLHHSTSLGGSLVGLNLYEGFQICCARLREAPDGKWIVVNPGLCSSYVLREDTLTLRRCGFFIHWVQAIDPCNFSVAFVYAGFNPEVKRCYFSVSPITPGRFYSTPKWIWTVQLS
jgi:hypothetical protein